MTLELQNDLKLAQYCIMEIIPCEESSILPNTRLKDLCNWDSLDTVFLADKIGRMLDCKISDVELEKWITVNHVMDTIKSHRNA